MSEQLPLSLERAPRFRREDFVVYPANEEAVRAVDAWPVWAGGALAVVGPEGSGKSHLAHAWAKASGAAVFAEPPDAATLAGFDGPVLLEDADREPAGEPLFHLINAAARPERGLLLTARASPRAWASEVPDLRSRLNAIRVVELGEPDEAGFGELLEAAFRNRGLAASPDLLSYLSRRVERSPAGAARIAERLDATALASGRPVSRVVARELLEDQADLFGDD